MLACIACLQFLAVLSIVVGLAIAMAMNSLHSTRSQKNDCN